MWNLKIDEFIGAKEKGGGQGWGEGKKWGDGQRVTYMNSKILH